VHALPEDHGLEALAGVPPGFFSSAMMSRRSPGEPFVDEERRVQGVQDRVVAHQLGHALAGHLADALHHG